MTSLLKKAPNALLLAAALILSSTPASSGVLHPGHSGHWYVPDRSGEGWVLEILGEKRALVYWFTYDESGNQRWLIGDGEIRETAEGWEVVFPEMLITEGPRFGADFDPASFASEVAGEGLFRFADCSSGTFEFQGLDKTLAFPVQRLTRTMGADCSGPLHGRPGEVVRPYAGQSGSWYDPMTAGQGFVLQWIANGQAVITWFTYDNEGNQQWMIGVGYREGDQLVFPEVFSPHGGRFGADFDSEEIEQLSWGRLEFDLICDGGSVRYESTLPQFSDGEYELERLTSLMLPKDCPVVPPLLTELYQLHYRELPVMNEGEEPLTEAIGIAGDATVVGAQPGPFGDRTIFRVLPPEGDEWIDIEENGFGTKAILAVDGETVAFNVLDGWAPSGAARFLTKIWRESIGTEPLPGQILESSFVRGGSSSASCLVGSGSVEPGGPERSWKWTSGNTQDLLPQPEPTGAVSPVACSDDGSTVIGNELVGESGVREDVAIRWVDDAEPTYIYDSTGVRLRFAQACSSDCRIIVGGDQVDANPDHPNFREPWLWSEETGAHYLGMPGDVFLTGFAPVVARDVTRDGSFVVGDYAAVNQWDSSIGSKGFIWTERTGQVLVSELLIATALGDDNWQRLSATNVSVDAESVRVLLVGEYRDPPTPWSYSRRAAVLELVPRKMDWFE